MDAIERDELLRQLKLLIDRNTPGTAECISKKVNISRRTLFRLIDHLKVREQQNIKFCRKRNCYYFTNNE